MFKLNNITRVLRDKEGGGESSTNTGGSHLDFTPTEIHQGVGVLADMKERAQSMQASEEDTGSVSSEDTSDTVLDDKDKETTTVEGIDKTAEDASEGATGDKEDKDATESLYKESSGYFYKGVEVDVVNTPEMVEDFKAKGIDIEVVNKELYSEEGLTEETRGKLNEAFGKMSVDMYLEGLETKNNAMLEKAQADSDDTDERIDKITSESTGDKFDEVMKWANDNLDSKTYSAYAEIINGTDEFQIGLALKDLTNKSEIKTTTLEQPEIKAKVTDGLLNADVKVTDGDSSTITSKEYKDAIISGEYAKDMKSWDAKRQAGLDAGIA